MYNKDRVRNERTGWRDQWISDRHRNWYGFDVPMTDIDFLVSEYDNGFPVAVVEYKHVEAWAGIIEKDPHFRGANYMVLRRLNPRLPVFVAFYNPETLNYRVYPLNEPALKYFTWAQTMTEVEYVSSIYVIRGREIPVFTKQRLIEDAARIIRKVA